MDDEQRIAFLLIDWDLKTFEGFFYNLHLENEIGS